MYIHVKNASFAIYVNFYQRYMMVEDFKKMLGN